MEMGAVHPLANGSFPPDGLDHDIKRTIMGEGIEAEVGDGLALPLGVVGDGDAVFAEGVAGFDLEGADGVASEAVGIGGGPEEGGGAGFVAAEADDEGLDGVRGNLHDGADDVGTVPAGAEGSDCALADVLRQLHRDQGTLS